MHVESILEEKMFQRNVKRPKKTLQMQMVFLKKCHSKAGFQTKIKFPLIWLSDNGKVIWKPIKAACVEHCGEPCGFLINSVSFLLISLCYFIFDEMHWLSEIKQYFSDSIYFGVFSQFMASCFVQFLSQLIMWFSSFIGVKIQNIFFISQRLIRDATLYPGFVNMFRSTAWICESFVTTNFSGSLFSWRFSANPFSVRFELTVSG